jgi:hypothetical protein
LPIPTANLTIYGEIYSIEQWMRRNCLRSPSGAVRARLAQLPIGRFDVDLEATPRQLNGRVHLDCENSDNAIWLLTLDELQAVLLADSTWLLVKRLTTFTRNVLESKLSEVREIRNLVGHNRAAGPRILPIAEAAAASLRAGIDHFKAELLYDDDSMIHLGEFEEHPAAGVPSQYARLERSGDWGYFQSMLSESDYFFALTRLPFEPFGTYLGVKEFLRRFESIAHDVLAILVNKQGDEFTLVWPKNSSTTVHHRVLRFFFDHHDYAWTETQYESQSPSAVCNPWVWFYENNRPRRD